MSVQSSGLTQENAGVVAALARSDCRAWSGTRCAAQYGGTVPDVGEVRHRHVVVPVVAVHGVVARPGRALQIGLPAFVRGVDKVADVRCADGVLGVLLERVIQRDAERAAAGEREVVAVARVLLGEEVAQQAGVRQQAIQVRSLPGVADDRAEVLVLEVEQEHVLETAGHARPGDVRTARRTGAETLNRRLSATPRS